MEVAKSIIFFIAAGLCEIAGGYLVWLWLREGRSIWYAALGAVLLVLYGVVPTLQPANFGRVYAATAESLLFFRCSVAGASIKQHRTDSI